MARNEIFRGTRVDRSSAPDLILIITGEFSQNNQLFEIARDFNRMGVQVSAVGVGSRVDTTLLNGVVTNRGRAFFYNDWRDIASDFRSVSPSVCLSGGGSGDSSGTYKQR